MVWELGLHQARRRAPFGGRGQGTDNSPLSRELPGSGEMRIVVMPFPIPSPRTWSLDPWPF